MHSKKVLHRDIKSENILIHKDGTIKISDLGLSCAFSEENNEWRKTKIGTHLFMAPEILYGRQYTRKVDIYSLGCFAYELATGNPPFVEAGAFHIQAVLCDRPSRIPERRWSNDFADFVD